MTPQNNKQAEHKKHAETLQLVLESCKFGQRYIYKDEVQSLSYAIKVLESYPELLEACKLALQYISEKKTAHGIIQQAIAIAEVMR